MLLEGRFELFFHEDAHYGNRKRRRIIIIDRISKIGGRKKKN
jgi:hypothetical protein